MVGKFLLRYRYLLSVLSRNSAELHVQHGGGLHGVESEAFLKRVGSGFEVPRTEHEVHQSAWVF